MIWSSAGIRPRLDMAQSWRLLPLSAHTPFENMAIDEAVLIAYERRTVGPTLRLYAWEPSGISVGFGQRLGAVPGAPEIPRVRRMTGGEAIYHDQELTYSIVTDPALLDMPRSIRGSYLSLGMFLIAAFAACGVTTDYFGTETPVDEAFCFAKPRRFDFCVAGKKLGGHAQRRRRGVLFQHGSIPLALDYARLAQIFGRREGRLRQSMISLSEAAGRPIAATELARHVVAAFASTFGIPLRAGCLTPEEIRDSDELLRRKYATSRWNECRRTDDRTGASPAGVVV